MDLLHFFTSYKQRNLLSLFHTVFQEYFYNEQTWKRETVFFSGSKSRLFKRYRCILYIEIYRDFLIYSDYLFFLSDHCQFVSFKKSVHFI